VYKTLTLRANETSSVGRIERDAFDRDVNPLAGIHDLEFDPDPIF
jgi:hypothetical protein